MSENKFKIRSLADIVPQARLENEIAEKTKISTDSFFFDKIYKGQLYTVVGMTNSGKTWWSLGTALSLAAEGHNVGYITTEDTTNELVSYLDGLDVDTDAFSRVHLRYVEEASEEGLRELIRSFHSEFGCEIVIVEYLRPDLFAGHKGDLNHTMGVLFKVLRGLLEELPITIIETIQANAALYQKDLGAILARNPNELFTYIDGGYTTAKRSQTVALIVKNKQNQRGIMILKAKHKYHDKIGKVFTYGNVREIDFGISYSAPVDYDMFNNAAFAASLNTATIRPKKIGKV